MKNIIFRHIKVWLLLMRDYFSLVTVVETIIENLIYFVLVNIFTKDLNISLALVFIIIVNKYVYKNINNLKNLINSDNFGYFLLKPINPIYRLAMFGINPINLISGVVIFFLLTVNFPQYLIIIFSALIMLLALYILVLSITLFTFKFFSIEKIFGLFILICLIFAYSSEYLVGLTTTFGQLSLLVFSVSLLFLSTKLWNNTVKKYNGNY